MSKTEILVLWLLNLLAAAGLVLWLRHYFSPEVREQRRRARSHGRVVSKARHPLVRLSQVPLPISVITWQMSANTMIEHATVKR